MQIEAKKFFFSFNLLEPTSDSFGLFIMNFRYGMYLNLLNSAEFVRSLILITELFYALKFILIQSACF